MTQRWHLPSDEIPGPSVRARLTGRAVGLTVRGEADQALTRAAAFLLTSLTRSQTRKQAG